MTSYSDATGQGCLSAMTLAAITLPHEYLSMHHNMIMSLQRCMQQIRAILF